MYDILCEFPFDSDRKRMTLIVRTAGRYIVMTKGADTKMFESDRIKIDVLSLKKV